MKLLHHKIEEKKWQAFSKKDQILNIASEICRIYQKELQEKERSAQTKAAYERVLELIDLTIEDPKWRGCHELYELRDAIASLYISTSQPVIGKFFYNWLVNFSRRF